MRFAIASLIVVISLSACSGRARPITQADILTYTGLTVCGEARIKDQTTQDEADTVPGFSVHVILTMPDRCKADLQVQLNRLAEGGCVPNQGRFSCVVLDASKLGPTKIHATIMVEAKTNGDYDFSFYE